ncbi:hypothetical protein E2C01_026959 [Portunus trituberculatus]|uniref:Uncharacterized protein n=1 Tax=Portunus trituberculatus TaxID=210409 RepID=A0A5B7EJL7_PORTR|nr:hypothetical protein [Portunus trituberculatus]
MDHPYVTHAASDEGSCHQGEEASLTGPHTRYQDVQNTPQGLEEFSIYLKSNCKGPIDPYKALPDLTHTKQFLHPHKALPDLTHTTQLHPHKAPQLTHTTQLLHPHKD